MSRDTIMPLGMDNAAGSWPEDYPHENGCYQCKCSRCGNLFMGHKRRIFCKLCHVTLSKADPLTTSPVDAQKSGNVDDKDAARYRWLCEKYGQTYFPAALERLLSGREGGMYIADGKASIDAAIDASMQKTP